MSCHFKDSMQLVCAGAAGVEVWSCFSTGAAGKWDGGAGRQGGGSVKPLEFEFCSFGLSDTKKSLDS